MTRDEVRAVVERNIAEVLPEMDTDLIQPEISLTDLGANSIDRMDVVFGALNDLGLEMPGDRLDGVEDVGTLVDALWACAASQGNSGRSLDE
ncbi:phosphopantetheine-binding protein [Actinomadura sp. DC4]|uniref:phosphopantetheine-binding protein n=1 Tax=Actinomadura sp. DC4 TaxID=3055069 RepID=UPI0025AF8FA4|nr:phosphopantetheine-binding protein [Actinomadura sp. DC4]MDN3355770.1 phosphopantetheine-binding protein [Actinomadura sp. DC4]